MTRQLAFLSFCSVCVMMVLLRCSGAEDHKGAEDVTADVISISEVEADHINGADLHEVVAPEVFTIPDYPIWDDPYIIPDVTFIQTMAVEYCEAIGPTQATASAFLLGWMPQRLLDHMSAGDVDVSEVSKIMGALYLSGYFGGLWLKDDMSAGGGHDGGDDEGEPNEMDLHPSFIAISKDAARRIESSFTGDDAAVIAAVRKDIALFLMLYGYNVGYLVVAADHPPEGWSYPLDGLVECPVFLGCTSTIHSLIMLEEAAVAFAVMSDPPTPVWQEMADLAKANETASVALGTKKWEEILTDKSFSTEGYLLLLELSVGYVLVSQATALLSMKAYAEDDSKTARRAALLQAGMMVWSKSYMMGLMQSDEPGFPVLSCGVQR